MGFYVCSNFSYPGTDGTTDRWEGQLKLAQALSADGFRATHSWGDTTNSGPSSPNYFWFDDLGRELAGKRMKFNIGLEWNVNNHAGWETLANDATGWTNYLAGGHNSTPVPYGCIPRILEIYIEGIRRVRSYYTAVGLDPDEYVKVHGVNEPDPYDWTGATTGGSETYTFHECCLRMVQGIKAAYPNMVYQSPVVGGYWGIIVPEAEIAAHAGWLDDIEAERTTHYGLYDEWAFNLYLNVQESAVGPQRYKQLLTQKLNTIEPKFRTLAQGKPICILEFGVATAYCGLTTLGRSGIRFDYLEQGRYLRAMYEILAQRPYQDITLYSTGGDDTNSGRMFGVTVGNNTSGSGVDDSSVAPLGAWRLSAAGLLEARGWTSQTKAPGFLTNWVASPTLSSVDIPGNTS
jgi:hypothetical protein